MPWKDTSSMDQSANSSSDCLCETLSVYKLYSLICMAPAADCLRVSVPLPPMRRAWASGVNVSRNFPSQHIRGDGVDHAIGELLDRSVDPIAVEVTPARSSRAMEEADRPGYKQVERAQYGSDLARRHLRRRGCETGDNYCGIEKKTLAYRRASSAK